MAIFDQNFPKIKISFSNYLFGTHGVKIPSLSAFVCWEPYINGLVGVYGSTHFLTYTSILSKLYILYILFLDIETLGHFLQAEIADGELASYHTSVKEENLMSGHV